jgi:hypothetical protein
VFPVGEGHATQYQQASNFTWSGPTSVGFVARLRGQYYSSGGRVNLPFFQIGEKLSWWVPSTVRSIELKAARVLARLCLQLYLPPQFPEAPPGGPEQGHGAKCLAFPRGTGEPPRRIDFAISVSGVAGLART